MSFYIALFFKSLIMGSISNNSNLAPILFFYFFFLLHTPVYAQDDICKIIDCVRGTCVSNTSALLGFDCICYSGWKQFTSDGFTLPPCVIPDCKLDSHCGSAAPAPPPPPPSPPPPFNFPDLSACTIVWCGDGICQPDGIAHSCQCFEGSSNLFNMTDLPCYKNCAVGAECSSIDIGPHSASPPPPQSNGGSNVDLGPPQSASPPPPQSDGSKRTSRCSGPFCAVNFVLLSAIILASTFIGH